MPSSRHYLDELAVVHALCARLHSARWRRTQGPRSVTGCATRRPARTILRLSTRPARTDPARDDAAVAPGPIVHGADWLREPGPNCQVIVAYTGAHRTGSHRRSRIDGGGSPRCRPAAVTSADRLACRLDRRATSARARHSSDARSHVERLLADVPAHSGMVTVLDGHPATLAWLGAVAGHRTRRPWRRAFWPNRSAGRSLPPLRY